MTTSAERLPRRPALAAKVAVEWGLALIASLCLVPLGLLLALLVKLTSRGPVLYIAPRVGRGGRCFRMLKFRSMYVGAPAIVTEDNMVVVEENDPRLTPVGKVLRMGFDELPQLINVLKGEMALIGPRPDVDWMLPEYTDDTRPRLDMRPGITGLAQVLRGRDLTGPENYQLDVWYVRNWSPWVDLKIALYTLPYVAGAKNIGRAWLRAILRPGGEPRPGEGA
ncbi:MAG: sugar transferase [Armatimonadetes bacterium]|nr:sugar transferase [Armatimonadota bacterium]